MKVLVTGASGFVGSHLVRALSKEHEVTALSTNPRYSFEGARVILEPFWDINWEEVKGIEAIVHQAAVIRHPDVSTENVKRVNTEAPLYFFEEALRRGVGRIVYASSAAVYGNSPAPFVEGEGEEPIKTDDYGNSKLKLDEGAMKLARSWPDARIVGLRYCNIYGPGESAKRARGVSSSPVYRFAQQILQGGEASVPINNPRRDLIYIDDAVQATIAALSAPRSDVINCGRGVAIAYTQIVDHLNRQFGMNAPVRWEPAFDKLTSQLNSSCDMQRARELTGFTSKIGVVKGIAMYDESGELRKAL